MQDPNQPLPITSHDNAGSFSFITCRGILLFAFGAAGTSHPETFTSNRPQGLKFEGGKHDHAKHGQSRCMELFTHSVGLISEVEYSDHYCKLATFRINQEATDNP